MIHNPICLACAVFSYGVACYFFSDDQPGWGFMNLLAGSFNLTLAMI